MKLDHSAHTCAVCGKGKGGNSHKECSKVLQAKHKDDARTKAPPKKLGAKRVEFLTDMVTK